ncbi:hypothetical protein BKA70DRAFT_1427153 [Coprinopsis sp. MPI-PUGE-AT-0042]|nr:hypothetical protein BKA70DRAFT_1427153 [Coprinopsis sp. MPI-PUGE-AT-0042]
MAEPPSQPTQPEDSTQEHAERDAIHYHTVAIFRSEAFAGMFSLDNPSEGLSDDRPIVLEGYKSGDFDSLLKVLIPQPLATSLPGLSKEEWISVLKLATIWQMDQIRKVAISRLSRMNIPPVEKITLAREYHVAAWLRDGITSLAARPIKVEEMAMVLGWEMTARIYAIRDSAQGSSVPSGWDQYIKTSQLACSACGSSSSVGVPTPHCCTGKYYSGPVKGYILKQNANGAPSASQSTLIKDSVLDLFDGELTALKQY